MLWIFKVARWTHGRCTKINKSPTICNGVRASSFEIWTANLAQSLTVGTLTHSQNFIFGDSNWKFCSRYPIAVGTLEPDIQMGTFLTWDDYFFMLLFLTEKKSKHVRCWIYNIMIQECCIHKPGKIRNELKLLFGVYWFLKLYTGSFDTVTSLHMGFHSERAAAGLGPSGLNSH